MNSTFTSAAKSESSQPLSLFHTSWKGFLAGFSHPIFLWNVVFVTNAKEKLFSGWRHKNIFYVLWDTSWSHLHQHVSKSVREITLCKTSLREVTFRLWVLKSLVWKNSLIKMSNDCLLLPSQTQILVRRDWMRILNGNLDREHLNSKKPSYS